MSLETAFNLISFFIRISPFLLIFIFAVEIIKTVYVIMNYHKEKKEEEPVSIEYDDENIACCPICGSKDFLYNKEGEKNLYCGQCGALLDWSVEERIDQEGTQQKSGEFYENLVG